MWGFWAGDVVCIVKKSSLIWSLFEASCPQPLLTLYISIRVQQLNACVFERWSLTKLRASELGLDLKL